MGRRLVEYFLALLLIGTGTSLANFTEYGKRYDNDFRNTFPQQTRVKRISSSIKEGVKSSISTFEILFNLTGLPTNDNKHNFEAFSRILTENKNNFDRSVDPTNKKSQTLIAETNLKFEGDGRNNRKLVATKGALTIRRSSNAPNIGPVGKETKRNETSGDQDLYNKILSTLHPLQEFSKRLLNIEGGPSKSHPCDQGSCYPATGNLLIGREEGLSASSTCGLREEEKYCIVSHLEDKKKCFRCDSRPQFRHLPAISHRIDNILHRFSPNTQQRSWWQSENGAENVSIQLDLEAEFHFTHLIITFKTFRPAAMLIERSFDFGKTWKVYSYFAHKCSESFPGIPRGGEVKNITDVTCEERYSSVAPSTEGEVIFRVLPRNLQIIDPYAQEVQNLLKMTNLRINFTKLHTLGDDRLDKRDDIQKKYYYAIYEMVVRGSCSCYGHASRCLPLQGIQVNNAQDMVHGRCECTHNTKGLNCEECEDFYRDLPWKPAFKKSTNACKKCNCNNHSMNCHFDPAVFEASGRVSGGVCDNCQHNTMGHKCEQCKPLFYLSPERDIQHEDACLPCDCDPRGSLDEGICDSKSDVDNGLETGRCHCKKYVDGRRCDRCQNGFWNLDERTEDGCQACSCNTLGTVGNQGCNVNTGECTCKRYVTGRDCNQCLPEYWGLSEDRDGCKPCDCDPGGAYDNTCDVITGQCRCRPHVAGRNCSSPEQGFFSAHPDNYMYEGELSRTCPNCQVIVREPYRDGRDSTWTGVGFIRVFNDSVLEFNGENLATSMEYNLVIRYEPQQPGWQEMQVRVSQEGYPDPDGPCANSLDDSEEPRRVILRAETREVVVQPPVCLEKGKDYKVKIEMISGDRATTMLVDSIALIPKIDDVPFFQGNQANLYRKNQFEHYRCLDNFHAATRYPTPDECKRVLYSLGYYIYDGAFECNCDPTGSTSSICDTLGGQCQCKLNVVGRRCERCAPGTFGFGPEGCTTCECNPIGSLDNFCDAMSGQCRCRPNTYGLHCDQCQPGYWNFPNCQRCNCNGHADTCDSATGTCTECRDSTTGTTCDRCIEGYYGDPRLGVDIPCRACPCPGTIESGHSFATRCNLDRLTNDVVCECKEGYSGPRCDRCAENNYGNPDEPGGECNPCSCNNNIDISRPGNCEMKTGACLQCLFNTEGFSCENCKPGFYGDAINQMCRKCVCNLLGTDSTAGPCDAITGQCPCLPNVVGTSCDQCKNDHWKIASGEGCESCDCDPIGSRSTQCNLYDGQCDCRSGFGGRKCDQCQSNFWGDPNVECHPCDCNQWGSATMQCDRTNGKCVCKKGIGGVKCDECDRGFIGNAPYCNPCGECFENWDLIINNLKVQTEKVIKGASEIKQQGATGAYTREFETVEKRIDDVKKLLASSSISSSDLDDLEKLIETKKELHGNTTKELQEISKELESVSERSALIDVSMQELDRKAEALQSSAASLKESVTSLQEANVEGALNSTKDAKRRMLQSGRRREEIQKIASDSGMQKRRVEKLLEQLRPQISRTENDLNNNVKKIDENLDKIDNNFVGLNQLVCDRGGNPCDGLCGGAGCGKCGGLSCDDGAITNAEAALKVTQEAFKKIKENDNEAEDLLRSVIQSKIEVEEAKALALSAFNHSETWKEISDNAKETLEDADKQIDEFLKTLGATPNDIRDLAKDVLSKNITLRPEQIEELAQGIRSSIESLTDIDRIIRATSDDLNTAMRLKNRSENAAFEANRVLQEYNKVREELSKALEAQKSAETAIDKAKVDIDVAENDLKQISSETGDAEIKSKESAEEVEQLKKRLEEVQKKSLSNDRRRKDASTESQAGLDKANSVEEVANILKVEYSEVTNSLEAKMFHFDGAKEKNALQKRANLLANNVFEKLKELQGVEKEYTEHDRRSEYLFSEIDSLTAQMDLHIKEIKSIEEYHRTCNS